MSRPTERIYTVFLADGRIFEMLTLEQLQRLVRRGQVRRRDRVVRGRTRKVRAVDLPELNDHWPNTRSSEELGEVDLDAPTQRMPDMSDEALKLFADEPAVAVVPRDDAAPATPGSGRYSTRGSGARRRATQGSGASRRATQGSGESDRATLGSGESRRATHGSGEAKRPTQTSGARRRVTSDAHEPVKTSARAARSAGAARVPTVTYDDSLAVRPLEVIYKQLQRSTPYAILCAKPSTSRAQLADHRRDLADQIAQHPGAEKQADVVAMIHNWQEQAFQALTQDRGLYLDAAEAADEALSLKAFLERRAAERETYRLSGAHARASGAPLGVSGSYHASDLSGELAAAVDAPTTQLPDWDTRSGRLVFGVGSQREGARFVTQVAGVSMLVLLVMALTSGGTQELTFWLKRTALWLRPVLLGVMGLLAVLLLRGEGPRRWGWELSPLWFPLTVAAGALGGLVINVVAPVHLGPDVVYATVIPLLAARGLGEALFYDLAITRTALIEFEQPREAIALGAAVYGLSAFTYMTVISGDLGLPIISMAALALLVGAPLSYLFAKAPSIPAMILARIAFWVVLFIPLG